MNALTRILPFVIEAVRWLVGTIGKPDHDVTLVAPFPLTPTLSLGERELRRPRWAEWNQASIRRRLIRFPSPWGEGLRVRETERLTSAVSRWSCGAFVLAFNPE